MLTPPNVVDLTWLSVVKTRAEVKSSVVTEDSEIQAAITAFSSCVYASRMRQRFTRES